MANAVPSRSGQINGAGVTDALFLKVWSGEVLASFENKVKLDGRHTVRHITSGKSAQFPVLGRVTASYHTPGAEIVGQSMNHAERDIVIDGALIADMFIADVDQAKNHYDVRAPYTSKMADVLAQAYDKNVAQCFVKAARASATVTGEPGGATVINASMKTDATVLAAAIYTSAQTLDENFVSEEGRFAAFKPAQYYLLVQDTALINKDFDGKGSYAEGEIKSVAGVDIVKMNNVPSTNVTTGPTPYQGDFTVTAGFVATPQAVGTVKMWEMAMEDSGYDVRWQGNLLVAKYMVGHDYLQPECAVELKTS